jgi:ribonuclease P protein component
MPGGGLVMLQRRSEFLRIRNGLRWSSGAFALEAKSRDGWSPPVPIAANIARFGLTVTKQLGGAVHRNRIRRRLKAALRQVAPRHARPGFDYVVIARASSETIAFDRLVIELSTAMEGVHSRRAQQSGKRGVARSNSQPK